MFTFLRRFRRPARVPHAPRRSALRAILLSCIGLPLISAAYQTAFAHHRPGHDPVPRGPKPRYRDDDDGPGKGKGKGHDKGRGEGHDKGRGEGHEKDD